MDLKHFVGVLRPINALLSAFISGIVYFKIFFLKCAEPGTESFLRGRHFVISVLGTALLNVLYIVFNMCIFESRT